MMRRRRTDTIGPDVIGKVEEYFYESASCVPDIKAVNKRTMKCCRSQCQNAMFSSRRRTRLPGTVPQVESQGCQDDTLPTALPESMRALHQPEAEAGCPKQGLRPQPHPGLQDQVKHGLDCYYDVPEATGCFTSWNGLHSTSMPRVWSTGH